MLRVRLYQRVESIAAVHWQCDATITSGLFSISSPWIGMALPQSKIIHSIWLPTSGRATKTSGTDKGNSHTSHGFEHVAVDHVTWKCTKTRKVFPLFYLQECWMNYEYIKLVENTNLHVVPSWWPIADNNQSNIFEWYPLEEITKNIGIIMIYQRQRQNGSYHRCWALSY